MALCNICSTIPFSSLPHPPPGRSGHLIAGKLPELWYHDDSTLAAEDSALGFPWHENIDALAASAKFCPLCGIVQKGVRSWLEIYEDAFSNNKMFLEFKRNGSDIHTGRRLWLTKRFGGAPGFIVLVRNRSLKAEVILLAGVSFSVEAGSPGSRQISLRPMDWDSSSPQSLEVAQSWLRDCIDNHEECVEGGTTLPSRVLDINSSGDTIKLVDGTGQSGRYASLSYCWGDGPHYTTDREHIKLRQLGFHLSELPRTLQDAVVIARHLGLGYLWIDSLCICQDDAEEWERESARMVDVYSNAHIVIAANHAHNSSVGCFHNREPRHMATITLPGFFDRSETDVTVQALLLSPTGEAPWDSSGEFIREPLTGRGWALQERVLAKRVLHYNTRQMYFECDHGIIGEDGCRFKNRLCSLNGTQASPLEGADRGRWNSLLWAYGDRKLTKATDKMPALSGLARLFAERLGAKYVAGLWSDDLIEGLAWQGLGSRKPLSESDNGYYGPSWSWASYDGIAATGVRERGFKNVAEIKDWFVELKTDANPYGGVQNAWICIRAPMTELKPSPIEINEHEHRLRRADTQPHPRMCTQYSHDENGNMVIFDHTEVRNSGEWRQWDLEILMLGGYPKERKDGTDGESKWDKESDGLAHCYCMVVIKVDDSPGTERMKRVGWMFMSSDEAARVRESEETWRTVMIV